MSEFSAYKIRQHDHQITFTVGGRDFLIQKTKGYYRNQQKASIALQYLSDPLKIASGECDALTDSVLSWAYQMSDTGKLALDEAGYYALLGSIKTEEARIEMATELPLIICAAMLGKLVESDSASPKSEENSEPDSEKTNPTKLETGSLKTPARTSVKVAKTGG